MTQLAPLVSRIGIVQLVLDIDLVGNLPCSEIRFRSDVSMQPARPPISQILHH
jgi:hypothetical protein